MWTDKHTINEIGQHVRKKEAFIAQTTKKNESTTHDDDDAFIIANAATCTPIFLHKYNSFMIHTLEYSCK